MALRLLAPLRLESAEHAEASQRSLHNAPIFRLLLKVAVKGTHQCDFTNFCGVSDPNATANSNTSLPRNTVPRGRATFHRDRNALHFRIREY